MSKDEKIWEITFIILGSIAALLVVWALCMSLSRRQVDCEELYEIKGGNGYAPMPKQCTKEE